MRTVTLALLSGFTLGVIAPVQAADLDYGTLRGPEYEPEVALIDWNGIYFGGHGGYSSASTNFKNAYRPLIANALRASVAESEFSASTMLASRGSSTDGASYGAFVGFNYQFDETVVGIEADYTRFDRTIATADSIGRFKTDSLGYLHTVSLAGSASERIEDYGTIRARGGYAIGNFLPYVTGGLAIGRVQSSQTVSIADYGYDVAAYRSNQGLTSGKPVDVKNFGYTANGFNQDTPEAGTPARSVIQNNKTKTMGGFALGAGLEFAVTQNILLRGEYQYVMLNDFQKSSGNGIAINTVRAGAAVKF